MATYRLFPSTNGPSSPVNYSGNFIAGVLFAVEGGGNWFDGYWYWVSASGQSMAPVKCALWSVIDGGNGVLLSGSVVTSGSLTAGTWNWIPLPTPLQLAPGFDPNYSQASSVYVAEIGINGAFPDTNDFFTTEAVSNGPLHTFSAQNGNAPEPWSLPNGSGVFSTGGTDPSELFVTGSDGSNDNFWIDVQVSNTVPPGYSGTYRLWPNKADANGMTGSDSAVNYLIATEIQISQTVALNNIHYYSPSGTSQLATWVGVWSVDGADSGSIVAQNTSPSWSGAAGSGWVSCSISGTLSPGTYKVSVYNDSASPDAWSAKDATTAYFDLGVASNGITWGPLYAPSLSGSSAAYEFGGAANASPPYSEGAVSHGQPTFSMPASGVTMPAYPYLWAPVNADTDADNVIHTQNYWVDLEVTPVALQSLLLAGMI